MGRARLKVALKSDLYRLRKVFKITEVLLLIKFEPQNYKKSNPTRVRLLKNFWLSIKWFLIISINHPNEAYAFFRRLRQIV